MQVKLIADNFISPGWPQPRRGEVRDVDPEYGRHLVASGLAIELKIEPPVKKPEAPSSVSQADQASQEKTVKRRRGRPKKSSS